MTEDYEKNLIYKVAINYSRKLYYEGFIIIRSNKEIIGYTDNNSFFIGNTDKELIEVFHEEKEVKVRLYGNQIFKELKFSDSPMDTLVFDFFEINIRIKMSLIDERIPKFQNSKIIEERYNCIARKYPPQIFQSIKESYLEEDS